MLCWTNRGCRSLYLLTLGKCCANSGILFKMAVSNKRGFRDTQKNIICYMANNQISVSTQFLAHLTILDLKIIFSLKIHSNKSVTKHYNFINELWPIILRHSSTIVNVWSCYSSGIPLTKICPQFVNLVG